MSEGIKDALGLFKKVAFHKGLPTVRDVPVLIRALSFREAAVREEAHRSLVWLAGRDLGREPRPWLAWWKRRAEEVRQEESVRKLFLHLKRCLLTGSWDAIRGRLSARLQREHSAESVRHCLEDSARALRAVYREARIQAVRIKGPTGMIDVDWGGYGFEFRRLPVVCENGSWKFDRLPWDSGAVRQSPRPVRANKLPIRWFRRRRSVFASRFSWLLLMLSLMLLVAVAFVTKIKPSLMLPEWSSPFAKAAFLSCLILPLPAVFLYTMTAGRIRTSRELREEIRRDGLYRSRDRR
jgi:hypothetical protein